MNLQDIINKSVTDTSQQSRISQPPTAEPKTAPPVEAPRPVNTVSAPQLNATPRIQEAPRTLDPMQEFSAFVSSFDANTSDLTKERESLVANKRDALDRKATRGERYNDLEDDLGLPEAREEVVEMDEDIAQLRAEFDKLIVDEQGRPIAGRYITGRQAQIVKQKAVQIGALNSIRAALAGKVSLAETTAKNTIDREFADIEAQIEADEFELQENTAAFEARTKKSKEQLQLALDERKRVMNEQKEERNGALATAQEAAMNGAPNSLVSQIANAKTRQEALGLAGRYIGMLDRQLKNASLAKANEQLAALRADGASEAELADAESAKTKMETLNQVMNVIHTLETAGGKSGAVGFSLQRNPFTGKAIRGTKASSYSGEIDRLSALLSFENLDKLKGAMSDKDLDFLKAIGSSLSIDQDEGAFDVELARIKKETQLGMKDARDTLGLNKYLTVDSYLEEELGGTSSAYQSAYPER